MARCMTCKKNVEVKNETLTKLPNGAYSSKGVCPDCGGKVNTFVSGKKVNAEKKGQGEGVEGGEHGLSNMDTSGAVFVDGGCGRCGGRRRSRKSKTSRGKSGGKRRSRKSAKSSKSAKRRKPKSRK